MRLIILLCLLLPITGCASNRARETDGYVNVIGGRAYYRMVGQGGGTPIIVVHGGPGLPHQYLRSLEALAVDRPVIFYDQLGCGKSDRPEQASRWIPRRFAREIAEIREAMDIHECYILADGWGAVFATEYMLTLPKGVRGLVLSSPMLSGPRAVADAQHLLDQLPAETRAIIRKAEERGATQSPEYRQAMAEFASQFVCRTWTRPKEYSDAIANMGWEPYRKMHGMNQILLDGTLAEYDRTGEFWQINVPTLLLCGRYDIATPETVAAYQSRLNRSQTIVFPESSHMPYAEESAAYLEAVRAFLRQCDAVPHPAAKRSGYNRSDVRQARRETR